MDNYLSHRWPQGGVLPGWAPERPQPKKKKGRRVLRVLLIALLIVALVAGIAITSLFIARRMIQQMMGSRPSFAPQDPGGLFTAAPSPTPSSVHLPRAKVGLGVVLELDKTLTQPLSPSEIYDLVAPSVVSVTAQTQSGSGIIMREDGYILTNYHVIENTSAVSVILLNETERHPAKLVGYDKNLDVAVLKIDVDGLIPARFGDSDLLRVGDPAYAIGNAMGYLYGTMTDGIISFLDRAQTINGTEMTLLQTTAMLNSGNSGGALVNQYGQVVGITVAKISGYGSYDAPQVEGLGFAIPISLARPFIDRILDAGESWSPVMGILCRTFHQDGMTGVWVEEVNAGGPAEGAGFRPGDLIIAANGKEVTNLYTLKRVLNDAGVGGTVTCTVLRGRETLELTLVLVDNSQLPS